ncbi:ABC transporter permease [Actinomycetota bacterium]|nr:ABC transporter permease [Actinomycetota bacterium]
MSTLTATPASPAPARRRVDDSIHLTFPRLVRSEWIKFWTVRSTLWVLPITVVMQVGIAFLIAFFTDQVLAENDVNGFDGTAVLQQGIFFSQLAIVVIAVLTITGEYSTGMIRTTLTTEPRRLPALWAKLAVLLPVTFVVTVIGTLISWAVTAPIIGDRFPIDLAESETQRVLLGGPLYMAAIALLSFAFGALLRHSAAALATVFGLLLVVETVFSAIPATFFREVSPFLPGTAGGNILYRQEVLDSVNAGSTATILSPWEGYGVLVAWGVVILAIAAVLLRRRDA